MHSILTSSKRKIKGVPKKAVTNVRYLEYREVLEEGSERRAAFAQLRSRAHEIAVETVEKKSLSPFNDKVYGLDAHNSRPLGYWRNLEQLRMLGAYAPPAATFGSTIYATDASDTRAALSAPCPVEAQRAMWRIDGRKGGYSRLLAKEEALRSSCPVPLFLLG